MRNTSGHTHYRPLWVLANRLNRAGRCHSPYRVERLIRLIYGADLPSRVDLSKVVLMHNGLGVVIHQQTTFKGRAVVFQHVTLGDSGKATDDGDIAPTIGDRVFIGAGASVLGPLSIGDECIIGAGAVVTKDVPAGHRAVGNPAVVEPLGSTDVLDEWFGASAA